jgi:hypothetical protein
MATGAHGMTQKNVRRNAGNTGCIRVGRMVVMICQPASTVVRAVTGRHETCVPSDVQSRRSLQKRNFKYSILVSSPALGRAPIDRDNYFRVSMAVSEGSRPVSRVLSWTAIPLGCTSPRTSSDLPGNHAGRMNVPLFGLAPGGVFPATSVARRAVRSYRTISPLPAA